MNKNIPLDALLAMTLPERIEAVASDVSTKSDVYASIDAHDLADALGVEQSTQPGDGWAFIRHAEIVSLEEFVEWHSPASDVARHLEGKVSAARMEYLRPKFEQLDNEDKPKFDFLDAEERKLLEVAIAEEELEANASNGMCCLAVYTVRNTDHVLQFEATIEDDGACLDLRTPYDIRDGGLTDSSNCVVDEW